MTVVPALLFVLLEMALRLAAYGYPTSFFIRVEGRDAYVTNPRFAWRFFPPPLARAVHPAALDTEKPDATYRIFVLGGSAAMGFPDESFSFGRVLHVMLRQRWPQVKFEVVNAAVRAISSHVVRVIAEDCAAHQPDLFVVYLGNNEVVGPYGPGTVFGGFESSLSYIRAGIWARSTKLGQLLADITVDRGSGSGSAPGSSPDAARQPLVWRGMEMFLDNQIAFDDPRLQRVYRHLHTNLTAICRTGRSAGAHVILCTVATNLKDSAPFASMHRADLDKDDTARWQHLYDAGIELEASEQWVEAVETYREAEEIDERFADLQFRLARCLFQLGDYSGAGRHYRLARDHDALRFRADSSINDTIRQVARDQMGVHLVEVEQAFGDAAPHGIVGEQLLYEHVHLNFAGNYALAAAVYDQVAALLAAKYPAQAVAGPPSQEQCAAALALTGWDRRRNAHKISALMARPPFTGQLDYEQCHAQRLDWVDSLEGERSAAALERSLQIVAAALAGAHDDTDLHERHADLLSQRGRHDQAASHWRFVVDRIPNHFKAHAGLTDALTDLGGTNEAAGHYRQAITINPFFAEAHNNYGVMLLGSGEPEVVIDHFHRAPQIKPEYPEAHFNLGLTHRKMGLIDEAIGDYRRAIEIEPRYAAAHNNLGSLLKSQGDCDQAMKHYRLAAQSDPNFGPAQNHLGIELLTRGEVDQAIVHLRRAVKLNPQVEVRLNLAAALRAKGQTDQAISTYQQALRADPNHAHAQYTLGGMLKHRGRPAEALEHFREALRLKSDWPVVFNDMAWLLATHGDAAVRDGDEAVRLAERAVRLTQERHPALLDTLAASYAAAGRFDDAVATAEEAHQLAVQI